MHGSCTFISSRYYTPSITFSTDLSSFEGKVCVPYFRDKIRAFQRRHLVKKNQKEVPAYDFSTNPSKSNTPISSSSKPSSRKTNVISVILPSLHDKQVKKRQHNTDQLLRLLSCYPIASTLASYLNKAELEALFSPKCSRQIFYKLRHKPNVTKIPRSPSTVSIFQRNRKMCVLYDNKSIAYKTMRSKEAAESQAYYMNLLDLTRECEKCGDTSHRYVPMLLDMGLTYQLFSVLQGIMLCYICKRSFCHACLVRFYVQGDPYRRNALKSPRHCCEDCLPKAQSLLGRRIGMLYRGPNEADLKKWQKNQEEERQKELEQQDSIV